MNVVPFDAGLHFLEALRPDPDLNMVEWCVANRRIEEASARRGPWSPELVPYVVEPMLALTEAGVQRIVLCWAAQVGKTENALINPVAYLGETRKDHIMVVLPTDEVKERVKRRIRPSLLAIPSLAAGIVDRKKALKTDEWELRQNHVLFASAASVAGTVSAPICYLLRDEIELHPEATLSRSAMRVNSYGHRARIVDMGTPGQEDGNVWIAYMAGDQSVWQVPCNACGEAWAYEWDRVCWEPREGAGVRLGLKADPTHREFAQLVRGGRVDVWMECPHCHHRHEGHDRQALNSRGAYHRQAPQQKRVRSFRVPALASPMFPLEEAVARFYEALGNADAMAEFYNQILALFYSVAVASADQAAVLARVDPTLAFGVVPDWCQWLSLGADVQADRCVWSLWAWAEQDGRERGHLVANGEEQGDGATSLDGLDALILRDWMTKSGQGLAVCATGVDAGFESGNVYAWVMERLRRGGRFRSVVPMIGRTHTKDLFTETPAQVHGRGEIKLLTVQSNSNKTGLWNVFTDTPGLMFHADVSQRFASEFIAEHRVRRRDPRGFAKLVWEVRPGFDANHSWDASCYAYALRRYAITLGKKSLPTVPPSGGAPSPKATKQPPKRNAQRQNKYWSDPLGRKLR